MLAAKEALIINNNLQMKLKQQKTPYCELYYDLVKAYDSVNHEWMKKVLEEYKISKKIIRIIKDIISKWIIKLY